MKFGHELLPILLPRHQIQGEITATALLCASQRLRLKLPEITQKSRASGGWPRSARYMAQVRLAVRLRYGEFVMTPAHVVFEAATKQARGE